MLRTSSATEPAPGAPAPSSARPRIPWRVWDSPPDQPGWARPALLLIATLAGLGYSWGANSASLEPFYGAAARSMASSWHDFIFGAFDPAGTITVDKLPGALWPQALALRLLGFHVWAIVLPQIVEGVAAILVLYRAVRRLAGPVAGIAAAFLLAISPASIALNRGNVADSLLILLTVLAADATSAAVAGRARETPSTRTSVAPDGRPGILLLAGVWVGLAFQAKMLQAWLVLPALALAYVVAAPPRLPVRLGHLAAAGMVVLVVSLSWMSAVSLVAQHSRPYVDGSSNDSLFSQVFEYNGSERLGAGALPSAGPAARFLVDLYHDHSSKFDDESIAIAPSWHRLMGGLFGREDGWLLPAALIAAAAVLFARRGAGRRDPMRACVLLWGTWLLVLAVAFSDGVYVNPYYVAALDPAVAALCGVGAALFWSRRHTAGARAVLAVTALVTLAYDTYLLSGGTAVPGWLAPAALCLGILGAFVTMFSPGMARVGPARAVGVPLTITAALLVPALTCVLIVHRGIGPFEAPYQPRAGLVSSPGTAGSVRAGVEQLSSTYHTPIVLATDTSTLAAPYIYYTGREILPIGGYLGGVPYPSLAQLREDVAAGRLRAFLIPVNPVGNDPRVIWVRAHCARTLVVSMTTRVQLGLYSCSQS
jgi:4-amino-4-deoxy-L-arabinose transferase-like glycosyltransferase